MGCDIHLYVEYKRKNYNGWSGFGKRIYMRRLYGMFAILADVRNSFNLKPISEPRGIPEDIASEAFEDYTLYVNDNDTVERWVKKEKAEYWVKEGYSTYLRENSFVTDPDAHSGSWLNSSELEQAIQTLWKDGFNGSEIEWVAVLDAMKSFEKQGCEARIVFWFDN